MAKEIIDIASPLKQGAKIQHGEYKGLTREEAKNKLRKDTERKREFENELIDGIFRNLENPGASIKFDFQNLPGDPYERIELHDGQKISLKRCVVKHLMNNCFKKRYDRITDMEGAAVSGALHNGQLNAKQMYAVEKVPRFAFMPLTFVSDLHPDNSRQMVELTSSF